MPVKNGLAVLSNLSTLDNGADLVVYPAAKVRPSLDILIEMKGARFCRLALRMIVCMLALARKRNTAVLFFVLASVACSSFFTPFFVVTHFYGNVYCFLHHVVLKTRNLSCFLCAGVVTGWALSPALRGVVQTLVQTLFKPSRVKVAVVWPAVVFFKLCHSYKLK